MKTSIAHVDQDVSVGESGRCTAENLARTERLALRKLHFVVQVLEQASHRLKIAIDQSLAPQKIAISLVKILTWMDGANWMVPTRAIDLSVSKLNLMVSMR